MAVVVWSCLAEAKHNGKCGTAIVAPGTASYALQRLQTQHAMWVAICLKAMTMTSRPKMGKQKVGKQLQAELVHAQGLYDSAACVFACDCGMSKHT
jgi:hypothetical protein